FASSSRRRTSVRSSRPSSGSRRSGCARNPSSWRRPRSAESRMVATITPAHKKEKAMPVQPYLFFDGRCEEAVEFYRKALGAEVTMLMRFRESPQPQEAGMVPPGAGDKVMHMSFRIGETTV